MNQSNSESARLAREATAIFNRCGALSEEATRLFTESTNLSRKAKAFFFGRSKLIAEARQLIDKGHALMSEEKRLMEEGNQLLEQSKKLKQSQPASNYVTCHCQHCDTGIEFNAVELAEENSLVPCPHCGLETKLFVPQLTEVPKSEVEKPTRDANQKTLEDILKRHETIAKIYYNQDELELAVDKVIFRKRGWANALASGMNGDRTILISSITAMQLKPAGLLTPGYILFSYAGSKPFMGGVWEATQDPDTFLFGREQDDQVADFKAKVEKLMQNLNQATPVSNFPPALTDEIRKLAELKQQGILSQEEFDAGKRKLLS
ncbi:MAG TPA: SHOCT domain-containing protein [Verrucomicrobiae bacterium]